MKATIDITDQELASMKFTIGRKKVEWQDLSRFEQIRFLNTLSQFHTLFKKFLKEEKP